MDVANILSPSSVRCEPEVGSKKHALELLSDLLAQAAAMKASAIVDGLASRERLGSTGLGASVAMPHTRMPGLARNVGAFLRLARPVEFGSADGNPVDMLFGLLVPDDSTPEELLEIRELVTKLCDVNLQKQLRAAKEPDVIYDLLTDNLTINQPAPGLQPSMRRPAGG